MDETGDEGVSTSEEAQRAKCMNMNCRKIREGYTAKKSEKETK